ncbi:hypothetical protein J2X71_006289 [Rhizobium sp. 1399]|nr:hypothetical protein [Rhizobium sp. 1399]
MSNSPRAHAISTKRSVNSFARGVSRETFAENISHSGLGLAPLTHHAFAFRYAATVIHTAESRK